MNNVLVERYSYDVFGRPTIRDPNGVVIQQSVLGNPYLFTGRDWDSETALYYYRARYYDYFTARFLQPDPTGYADGLNLYAYVGNNPVGYVDPLGLCKSGGWIDWLQGGIDVVGIFDPTGISDAINALIYLGRGQLGNAGISALAIIPYIGDLGKAGKYGAKALKYSDEAASLVKTAERHHQLPKQFAKRFEQAGLKVDDYVIYLEKSAHRLKPGGLHTGSNRWNKQWSDFFSSNQSPSKQEILDQLSRMRKEFNLR